MVGKAKEQKRVERQMWMEFLSHGGCYAVSFVLMTMGFYTIYADRDYVTAFMAFAMGVTTMNVSTLLVNSSVKKLEKEYDEIMESNNERA